MVNTFAQVTEMARETLVQLRNVLTIAPRVHRNFENVIGQRGRTIDIRKPVTLTANDFLANGQITVNNVVEDTIQATLNNFWEVSYEVGDLDRTVDDRDLLRQFVTPAAIALAEKIETSAFNELVHNTPTCFGANNANIVANDFPKARRLLANQKAPVMDRANFHALFSFDDEEKLLTESNFLNSATAGNTQGVQNAELGRKYGFNTAASQLVPKPAPADTSGAVNNGAGYAAGVSTIAMDGVSAAPPVGTTFKFANHSTIYTVAADTTTSSLKFIPALTSAVVDDEAITFYSNVNINPYFHRDAVSLAMRPLDLPDPGTGAVGSVVNFDGYSLRVVYAYDVRYKKHIVSMDAVWAVKMLTDGLAVKQMTQKAA